MRDKDKIINVFSISICIAKPRKRIRATSSYKLFTSLLQACDKPSASCFEQANFRLHCTTLIVLSICT